jgi:cytochrome c-type protein NapB
MKTISATRSLVVGLTLCAAFLAIADKETVSDAPAADTPEATENAERDARENLRAFYTAPPVIPHPDENIGVNDCATCHQEVRTIGDRTTLRTPHAQFSSCRQCHVPAAPAFGEPPEELATSWKGLETPKEGTRAHVVAPPTIPHRVALRDQCLSCHDKNSPFTHLRTSHPERSSCQQCHVAAAPAEFTITRFDGITAAP